MHKNKFATDYFKGVRIGKRIYRKTHTVEATPLVEGFKKGKQWLTVILLIYRKFHLVEKEIISRITLCGYRKWWIIVRGNK